MWGNPKPSHRPKSIEKNTEKRSILAKAIN